MDTDFALKEYGLSDKEILVYKELLPLGSVNLQEISKRINLPRTTIYNTLTYLTGKGLVSFIIKKGVRFYDATDPEKLVDKIEEKKALLKSVLPELQILKNTTINSSSAEIYQGSKGLYTILSDVFRIKQNISYFGSYSLSKEMLKHQPEHFRTIRIERKIPARIVIDYYDEEIFHKKEYKKLTKIKFHKGLKDFPCMIFIYGKKVAIYTVKKELIGIIITNEQVSDAMQMMFEMYWSSARSKVQS
ncbi:MAG: TrmB family transcriptional regulator [Candidatus Woesearchaeota archaeon]